jgi:hypothetical protein
MRPVLVALFFAGCSSVAVIPPLHDAGTTGEPDAAVDAPDAGHDAGVPVVDAGVPCGAVGAAWQGDAEGLVRSRCLQGQLVREACARGCLRPPPGTEASCLGTTDTLSCPGSYGTVKSTTGDYYLTAFGCWVDAAGAVHTDPGDNCIPSCLDQARASGLCMPSDTGPQCEQRVTWYTADGARFGCLARVKVTNPANGKAVVAVALDYGPGCSLERGVNMPILDASGRVDRYLFGSDQGATDRALVHVVEVDQATPLGPVP